MGLWGEMKTTTLRTQSVYSELALGRESATAACVYKDTKASRRVEKSLTVGEKK